MDREIQKLVAEEGMGEVQAYYAVKARRILASRKPNREEVRTWILSYPARLLSWP
jgi:hypothetical protein